MTLSILLPPIRVFFTRGKTYYLDMIYTTFDIDMSQLINVVSFEGLGYLYKVSHIKMEINHLLSLGKIHISLSRIELNIELGIRLMIHYM